MNNISALILAAGEGTRMKSARPKVVHKVNGLPMLSYLLNTLDALNFPHQVVVVGYQKEQVVKLLPAHVAWVEQVERRGTGDAVKVALELGQGFLDNVLVLCGDIPLLTPATLEKLIAARQHYDITILSASVENPFAYGRIVRNEAGEVLRIVEEKDATAAEREIKEINSGIYLFNKQVLADCLTQLTPANKQKEYYLTDVVEICHRQGGKVGAILAENPLEITGINSLSELAWASKYVNQKIIREWQAQGVTVIDPESTYIELSVKKIGRDTIIYPQTFLEGETEIGDNCCVGPVTRLTDCQLGNQVTIQFSVLKQAQISDNINLGPFYQEINADAGKRRK